jgi:EAL domain-containing protein (putative c-di-GMP-specific phosphodiesterase class I)
MSNFGTELTAAKILSRRTWLSGMTRGGKDLAIVRSVIELAHNLGLETVAEGVEDSPTREALVELGCDQAQGYYFGRPMSAHELGVMVKASMVGQAGLSEIATGDPSHPPALRMIVN